MQQTTKDVLRNEVTVVLLMDWRGKYSIHVKVLNRFFN
jgi:hypothetical protein